MQGGYQAWEGSADRSWPSYNSSHGAWVRPLSVGKKWRGRGSPASAFLTVSITSVDHSFVTVTPYKANSRSVGSSLIIAGFCTTATVAKGPAFSFAQHPIHLIRRVLPLFLYPQRTLSPFVPLCTTLGSLRDAISTYWARSSLGPTSSAECAGSGRVDADECSMLFCWTGLVPGRTGALEGMVDEDDVGADEGGEGPGDVVELWFRRHP